jgi:dehydrogenase/reductase SDR family member 12
MPVIDAALEATVVGSYTSVGSAIRSRLYHWDPTAPMPDRTVVVTGATSGIGQAATLGLAGAGARVCLVGRDPDRLESTRRHVGDLGVEATVEVADLEDLAQVRVVAAQIADRLPEIDALVNNAGALFRGRRQAAGFEATVALNLLSPFLLTELLLPALEAARGRVITVTSAGLYTQRFELSSLVVTGEGYDGTVAYARAKRAQVVLTEEWQRRYGNRGVAFHAVHPGWADTPGLSRGLPGFARVMKPWLRTPAAGADTAVWLAGRPAQATAGGRLWFDRQPRSPYRLPWTWASASRRRTDGAALWDWCHQQVEPPVRAQ